MHFDFSGIEPAKELDFESVLSGIKDGPSGFYQVLDHVESGVIDQFIGSIEGRFSKVVLLGIGGSALGARAIYEAFGRNNGGREFLILDNVDPVLMRRTVESLEVQETLFLVISKSGGTLETVSQYCFFRDWVTQEGGDLSEQMVFITGTTGFLRSESERLGAQVFDVPEEVGGRFSVLTNVGLVPAALMGVDYRALVEGAVKAREEYFLNKKIDQNRCFQMAASLCEASKRGEGSVVFMPYGVRFCGLSDWWVQLVAESTGKVDNKGENVGITPIKAQGVTDQHAQMQLFRAGPADKVLIFLLSKNVEQGFEVPFQEGFEFLGGKRFGDVFLAEGEATVKAYKELDRANIVINVGGFDETSLGALFLFWEGVVAMLGEMMNINVFDQPGVERGKEIAVEQLTTSSK